MDYTSSPTASAASYRSRKKSLHLQPISTDPNLNIIPHSFPPESDNSAEGSQPRSESNLMSNLIGTLDSTADGTALATGTESKNRLIIVANRLPMSFSREDSGKFCSKLSSGGLVSALTGVQGINMIWIGWPGAEIAPADKAGLTQQCEELNCKPVFLSDKIAQLYYNGFANSILWPLFHYITVPIEDSVDTIDDQWQAYISANKEFAEAVLSIYEEGDLVWVHDYHLMLLPAILRQRKPRMRLGWFLHTPFPSSEIYRAMPYREEVLHGILAADLIGFHIYDYARHFKSACTKILGLEVTHQGVEYNGRFVQVGTFPIGIDAHKFVEALDSDEVRLEYEDLEKKLAGKTVLLGIDRLDYIKGIPNKLFALERFFPEAS